VLADIDEFPDGFETLVGERGITLSGGQRQRVALARALVTRPDCLLADEPTGNLDQQTAAQMLELMLRLNQEMNTALVVVTHDLSIASHMQHRWRMHDGILVPEI
jgi:lipoprotein-releasing system ATP-binding protein